MTQLGASILSSPTAMEALRDRPKVLPATASVFDELQETHGELLWGWLQRHGRSDRLLADKLMAAIRDPGMAGTEGLRRALRLTSLVAAVLPEGEVQELCSFLVLRANQPLDPYGENVLLNESRAALVELVFAHPKLATQLVGSASLHDGLPPTVEAVAAAERRRRRLNLDQMLGVLQALAGAPDLAVKFADVASESSGRSSMDVPHGRRTRAVPRMSRSLLTALSVLSGPILVGFAHLVEPTEDWPVPQPVGIAEGLVALTLIATVHVFTVTLSAQRLPGSIASVVGRPRAVFTCYSTSLALVAITLASGSQGLDPLTEKYLGGALVAVFALALIAVMAGIVRRTDPGRAAAAFVDSWEGKAVRQGRRLGKLQAAATHVALVADSLVGIDVGVEPELVGSRRRVFAPRSGLLVPDERRLRAIAGESEVAGGEVTIRLVAGLGGMVSPQEQTATLNAYWSGAIPDALVRRTARAMRIKPVRGVNDIAAAATALVAMAVDLAAQRQFGTAKEVASSATRFISLHAHAARESWTWHVERRIWASSRRASRHSRNVLWPEVSPPNGTGTLARQMAIPALRDSAQRLVEARVATPIDLGDIPEEMLRALLELSRLSDSTAAIIAAHLPSTFERTNPAPAVLGAYFELAAVRAMEQEDTWTLSLLMDKLAKLSRQNAEMIGESSVVVAIAAWVLPSQAVAMVDWLQGLGVGAAVHSGLARVGAAAMAGDQLGVAVRCAYALLRLGADREALRRLVFGSAGLALDEGFRSQIRGGYLGSSPADAYDGFFKLWKALDVPASP